MILANTIKYGKQYLYSFAILTTTAAVNYALQTAPASLVMRIANVAQPHNGVCGLKPVYHLINLL